MTVKPTMTNVIQYYADESADVTQSPHTELTEVPDRAIIEFEDGKRNSAVGGLHLGEFPEEVNDDIMDEMMKGGIGISFLIERAMLDPDAKVVPVAA